MGHGVLHFLREFVADYGYWAVALMLLCENAGLPVPGETTLLVASFFAYSEHKLKLGWIIVIVTCAATIADNLGFAIGRYGGRPLLDRYEKFPGPARCARPRGGAVRSLRRVHDFLCAIRGWTAHYCRTARRGVAHALAGVCPLQLLRCSGVGQPYSFRRVSIRAALASAGANAHTHQCRRVARGCGGCGFPMAEGTEKLPRGTLVHCIREARRTITLL